MAIYIYIYITVHCDWYYMTVDLPVNIPREITSLVYSSNRSKIEARDFQHSGKWVSRLNKNRKTTLDWNFGQRNFVEIVTWLSV